MNLIQGNIITSPRERDRALAALPDEIWSVMADPLTVEEIVAACDQLGKSLNKTEKELLIQSGVAPEEAADIIMKAKRQLERSFLMARLDHEIDFTRYPNYLKLQEVMVKETLAPLGTLLHIMAGNQPGLSIFSVLEGLITGNINIVKLSGKASGMLEVEMFRRLMAIEPRLAGYIYVFDYTSKDLAQLKQLMDLADGIVIWGGDRAIESIRMMADAKTKLIEWGHKNSFAYVSRGYRNTDLIELAKHIVKTNQLQCSSCQGIYLDTDSMDELETFASAFLPMLDDCYEEADPIPLEIRAKTGVMLYSEELINPECRIVRGKRAAVLIQTDSKLEAAIPYGHPWIKRLPRKDIVKVLRPYKGHLQTAGLLCLAKERDDLTKLLWHSGVVRVTDVARMSDSYSKSAHDGEFPLRRYVKVLSAEFYK